MNNKKILIIEDDEDIQSVLQYNLKKTGFTSIVSAEDGKTGLEAARNEHPAIILLDLMLPEMDGITVCKNLKSREDTAVIPIIMLTAKSTDNDIIAGLEAGADDYVTKPFNLQVLTARIKSALRRTELSGGPSGSIIRRGPISIDVERREVLIDDQPVVMTYSEFEVLLLFARSPGRIYSRSQIVNRVKGDDYPVTERAIDVQIVGLRKKLGEYSNLIETVRGVGYRFSER